MKRSIHLMLYDFSRMIKGMLKEYYQLTKPGIIRGNVMTAAAGFLLASRSGFDTKLFLALNIGIAAIIASACVLNNYIDRDIDKKMKRTKKRALVTGSIPVRNALIFAGILGIAGFTILFIYTNILTVIIGAVGILSYVALYGYYKRRSMHGTLVGSISGSTSLVAGYCAVAGQFDGLAALLFITMAVWQMPHFYAIAVYRRAEYAAANIPVLPVVKGYAVTRMHIINYIALFIACMAAFTLFGYTGYVFLGVMILISVLWMRTALKTFAAKDNVKWGHQVFGYSLITLLVFSLMISIDRFLP